MARVNDKPVAAQNPLPQFMMVKDINTGQYIEVDSATPLQVVLSQAVPVGGSTIISIDDGFGNPITISRSTVDPGAMKVEVINQGTSKIIQLDDGAGNPVLISHVAGIQNMAVTNFPAIQPVSQTDDNRKLNFDDGLGGNVPAKHLLGEQNVIARYEDPVTGIPYGVKNVNGKQRVSSTDYFIEVAQGNIPNHTNFSIHSETLVVPIVRTLATNLAIPVLPNLAIPAAVSIVSTSAIDTGPAVGFSLVAPTLPATTYPIGSTIFNIDFGAGQILAGDTVIFGADVNIYTVLSYVPNIAPATGGILTLSTPTLVAHLVGEPMTLTPALPNIGLYSVDVYGLDALGNFYEENVVLNGITPVLTTGLFSTVNYIIAKTANAAALGAAGTMTCTAGAVIIQQIDIGGTRSMTLYFKMPKDKKGFVSNVDVATDNKVLFTQVCTTLDEFSKTVGGIFTDKKSIWSDRGTTTYKFEFPLYLPPLCELKVEWDDRLLKGLVADASAEIFMENI